MSSRRALLMSGIVAGACVCLHATPAHAAVQSASILDRVTQLFQGSVTKWGNVTTHAALVLFWMLATVACVWELGGMALRGGSMEAALAFLLRFGFIEGLWLWIIQNAVPIGTAIIDSLRKLGSLASGRPQDLMPSSILDIGFAILWKTIKFVFSTGLTAPIVSFFALLFSTAIFITFVFTALNMVLLIVSQWFLLYGGIFFLGLGGAPWESDKAKNYLYLTLSIGAQLFAMAGIVGIGQSFIEGIYAQLSGDTSLGELAVILCVALVIYKLADEIPKMFAQFVPGAYRQHGYGGAAVLGGLVALGASFTAATAMAKSAATTIAGVMRAAGAAHSAAKAQSQPHFTARSQTGVGAAAGGGSIGPAGGGMSARTQTHTQGPLGAMLSSSGIGPSHSTGSNKPAFSARADTNTPVAKPGAHAQKLPASQRTQKSANDSSGAARTSQEPLAGAAPASSDSAAQSTAASPRGGTHVDEQAAAPERAGDVGETPADIADNQSGSAAERVDSAMGDGASASVSTQQEEADRADAPSSESSAARTETSPVGQDGSANAVAKPGRPSTASATSSADAQTVAASIGTSGSAASTMHAPQSSTTTTESSASGSSSTAPQTALRASTQAATGNANTATSASEQSTPNGAGNVNGAGSPAPAISPSASGPAPAGSSSSNAPYGASSTNHGGSAPEVGAQRSSTAIGGSSTILAAARIVGEHVVQHQRDRLQRAKAAFWAEADQTVSGQIAQAIRKKHGLDTDPIDSEPTRSASDLDTSRTQDASSDDGSPAQSNVSGPKHPADWVTGDEPMTDKQWALLERTLGDQFDPNLTKAEAAILIDEILNDG